jgi:hypothetical protein
VVHGDDDGPPVLAVDDALEAHFLAEVHDPLLCVVEGFGVGRAGRAKEKGPPATKPAAPGIPQTNGVSGVPDRRHP